MFLAEWQSKLFNFFEFQFPVKNDIRRLAPTVHQALCLYALKHVSQQPQEIELIAIPTL